jgi:uncharacterized protein YjbI with pentapeptide repeats
MKLLTSTAVSLLLIGLTMSGTAYSQVPSWEREALITFYNATGGDNWRDNTGWNGAAGTECDWYGVTCSSGVVSELHLSYGNGTGSIPPELFNLTGLTSLILESFNLTGSIPAELGNLTNLTVLTLSWNQLSGPIPPELSNLSSLINLSLQSNQLSGSIPAVLANLTNLTALFLHDNQLTGSIPPELGNARKLNTLQLYNNQLTGSLPAQLANVANLYLYNNQFSGSIPPALADVNHLDLSNNPRLDRAILLKLYSSTYALNWTNKTGWAGAVGTECDWYGVTCTGGDLTGLNLASNNLVGTIPSELGDLTTLTSLDFSGNSLSGAIPTELANLTGLTALDFSTNFLTGPLPQWLSDMAISSLNTTDAFTSPPVVAIEGGSRAIADTDGIAGESVSFTGTATDSDGTIATTQWLVGGSVVATGLSATISLPNRSTVVTFKATDNDEVSSTTTATITVATPTYTVTDEWPSPYNGVTPDSSLGLAFNNIGIYDAAGSTIYTCLRVFTGGLPGSVDGIGEFDIGFTIVSLDEGTVQVTKFREFNVIGALNENVELPDCSGKFETTTGVFTDTIETKLYPNFLGNLLPIVKTFETTFNLVDPDNLILKLSSYQELTAD